MTRNFRWFGTKLVLEPLFLELNLLDLKIKFRKLADHATQTRAPEIEQLLNTADLLQTDPFQDNHDDVSRASAYSFRSGNMGLILRQKKLKI